MKFQNTTDWSDAFLRNMLRWVCKEVELPIRFIKGIKFRNRFNGSRFSGRCCHWTYGAKIVVSVGPEKLFPWTDGGKSPGIIGIVRTFNDRLECLVNVTAHEVRHAYAQVNRERTRRRGSYGSSERATEHTAQQVLAKFRENREQLLAEWGLTQITTPVEPSTVIPDAPKQKSGLTVQERNEAKARRMLEAWERKLRLAKTKVTKYRGKVRRYERIAATKQRKGS